MKHAKDVFKSTSMWKATREKEIAAFEAGVEYGSKHWKANHDNVVRKLRLFTQRNDLPVDRIEAYNYVRQLEHQILSLKYQLAVEKGKKEKL